MKRRIFVRSSFEATHSWPTCPYPEVQFLKNEHRHRFLVEIKIDVESPDRQYEFFMVKEQLDKTLKEFENKFLSGVSCEEMCDVISKKLVLFYPELSFVSVSEDGENGAELCLTPQ